MKRIVFALVAVSATALFAQKATMVTTTMLANATNAVKQSAFSDAKTYADGATNATLKAAKAADMEALGRFAATGKVNNAAQADLSSYANQLWDGLGINNYDATELLQAAQAYTNGLAPIAYVDNATNANNAALMAEIAAATNSLSSDSIQDGQNMIDAAGNVYTIPRETTSWRVTHSPSWVTTLDEFYFEGPYFDDIGAAWYVSYNFDGGPLVKKISDEANYTGGDVVWTLNYTDENEEVQVVEVTSTATRRVAGVPVKVGEIVLSSEVPDIKQDAVNKAHYLYDRTVGVTYEMRMRNDFFDLVCVTNVDLTNKNNW